MKPFEKRLALPENIIYYFSKIVNRGLQQLFSYKTYFSIVKAFGATFYHLTTTLLWCQTTKAALSSRFNYSVNQQPQPHPLLLPHTLKIIRSAMITSQMISLLKSSQKQLFIVVSFHTFILQRLIASTLLLYESRSRNATAYFSRQEYTILRILGAV